MQNDIFVLQRAFSELNRHAIVLTCYARAKGLCQTSNSDVHTVFLGIRITVTFAGALAFRIRTARIQMIDIPQIIFGHCLVILVLDAVLLHRGQIDHILNVFCF